jgi:chromate reductase
VRDLRERIAAADGLLVATPEYNGSIPGLLKNAVDWASRPFPGSALRGKTVAVIGASTGAYGGMWAQTELRKSLGVAGARVLQEGVAVPMAQERFDAGGTLLDAALRDRLAALLAALAVEAAPIATAA